MSGRSPSKRGRKKKSNKGRKPKKPLSKEEIAAKKNQKNMRETCRRVEINLHYELLYHSLGQNLVYNRAERVQLLRKAIIRMAELKAQVQSLSDQVRAAGMTPRSAPNFQLNDSQKLFMLVQRWARNDNGKKCSRAKLKPVGIEIIDDNDNAVPITVPMDGRPASDQLAPDDHDHIPFWASWETDTYMVVDQDAFEKACNQAIIAGWDGKLGSKGAYYQPGLPAGCGLTIASPTHYNDGISINDNSSTHSPKYKKRRGRRPLHHDMDEDSDDEHEDDGHSHNHLYLNGGHNHIQHHNILNSLHSNTNNSLSMNGMQSNRPFPPRIDFPEIVVQGLQARALPNNSMPNNHNHSSSDSRSENNSTPTSEPPIKKQKLSNGRTRMKRKREDSNQSSFDTPPQFVQQQLPLSVPFPAVNGQSAFVLNGINGSPFMNLRMNSNNTPEQTNTSSDTNSQNSNNLHHVKSEPLNDSTPQSTPQLTQQPPPPQFQVHLPHFLASFPPHPTTHPPSFPNTNGHNHLVPLTTTFPIQSYPPHPAVPNSTQQHESRNQCNQASTISKDGSPHQMTNGAPTLPSTINLPSISNHTNHLKDNNNNNSNDTPENLNDTPQSTPAPSSSHINRTNSPSGSRTSHETRNSVVFTPANHHKNSSTVSTDSNSPEQNCGESKSPRPEKQSIHLPDNTSSVSFLNRSSRSVATTPSIDNYMNELNWNNDDTTSTPQGNLVMHSDDYNMAVPDTSYDVITNHHIGMMNEIQVSGFQDASTSTTRDDSNGMKGSVFYG